MRITFPLPDLGVLPFLACENKETVLEVETSGGKIEVQQDRDSGAVGVEVDEE